MFSVECHLGISLRSASVCYNKTTSKLFLDQLQDLVPYYIHFPAIKCCFSSQEPQPAEHAMSDHLWDDPSYTLGYNCASVTRPFSRFSQAGPGDEARTANSKHFTTYRWLRFLTRDTKFYCCKKSVIFSNLTISLVLTTFCNRPKNFDSVSSSRKYGHVRWACELGMDPLRLGVGGRQALRPRERVTFQS